MMQPDDHAPASAAGTHSDPTADLRRALEQDIRRLHGLASRGLWAFSLFLIVSLLAWRDFPLLPLPDTLIAALGTPPQARYISLMLVVYTFSAVILSLSRMMGGMEHKSSFCHVGYLTLFFLFYHLARALNDNFWAVLGAGVTILGVESYRLWTYSTENIQMKSEQLTHLAKTGRLPPRD